ncbi:MAG: condensation domain-containing protein [Acidobacteria bacterium]|nr:condensation domain-containing protein [Acidobacteriota bacterium]
MITTELLSHLRGLDVKLWVEGDKLRYSAPDGVMTPALRAELVERKAEILVFLRQAEAAVNHKASSILPASRNGELPLSFAQQRMWLLDQLMPGSFLYNISEAVRLTGALDVAALEQTTNEIVRRHEVLRTTFPVVDGQPVQNIAPSLAVTLPVVDLGELDESEREAEVRRLATEQARQPFDLARGPLARVILLRLGKEEHVVLFTLHHIVSDGWSMGVLVQEVARLYEAFSKGSPSPLAELPFQYADFAHWQRQWLQGKVLEAQLSYWKRRLGDAPAFLELPTDRPRPAVQTFQGAHQSLVLSGTLSESLKELSRQEGVTLFMTLLAALNTLLYRYTGREDMIVGTPVAGRTQAELEGLIGFFVNTLVLRTDLSSDPGFRELLGRVREVVLGAFANQDIPFEKLADELQPGRDRSLTPWIQAAFVLQAASSGSAVELPGLTLSPLKIESETAKTDLILSLVERPEGLRGSFDYNTDLFDASTIARMAGDFQTMLESIVADPEQRISMLPPSPGQVLSPVKHSPDEFDQLYAGSNLTRNQLLIWTGQKLRPGVPFYDVVFTFLIPCEIDPARFQKAFQTLVNSSDALRTVIEEIDGVPRQRVLPHFPYTVEYLDFSHVSDPRAAFRAWARQQCQVSFDLAKRSFDSALIKISDREFAWYLNQHHIMCDALSISLIFRLFSEFYGRSLRGQLNEKVELPAFRDYLDYEREYRSSLRYLKSKTYWERKLSDEPEPLAFYGKAPHKQTTRVQRVTCDLGSERTQKLIELAHREGIFVKTQSASLFNIFAAVLCAYLYRISGNRRLSLGSASHNRRSMAFTETIGVFMEVHPLYITIEEDDTFLSLVKKAAVEAQETLQHSECIIGKKAYDVFLNYHTTSFPGFHGAPVQVDWIHPGHEIDSLAVQVHHYVSSGNFGLYFDFHCDVFDEQQRSQAIQCFLRIMDTFLEDHTQSIDRIDLLSAEEKQRILVGFNHKDVIYPEDRTITRLFEEQVEKTPAKPAAVYGDSSLTFQGLNNQADKLANLIKRLK